MFKLQRLAVAGIAATVASMLGSATGAHAVGRVTAADWTAANVGAYSNSCGIQWSISGQVNFGTWTCTLGATASGANCEDDVNLDVGSATGNILATGCTATLSAQSSGEIIEIVDGSSTTWTCSDSSLVGTLHYVSADLSVNLTVPISLVESGTTEFLGSGGFGTSFNEYTGSNTVVGPPGPGEAVVEGDTSQDCVAIPGAVPVYEGQITF